MKQYIGTKIIKAEPMNLGDYNTYRKWDIPADEDPLREGFLVEYENGYQSWSPKETFDAAYRLLTVWEDGRVTIAKINREANQK